MLRGIAVLLVLCHHHQAIPFLQGMGWIGVDLFFVLSGFLVSGLVFDEYRRTATFKPGRFLVRRGFKIYPSFYALIILTSVLMWATGRQDPLINYLAEVFFFQNYHEGLWGHTWTLAVEEHFYLLLVLSSTVLISLRFALRWRTFVAACIIIFLVVMALRWNDLPMMHPDVDLRLFPTHFRIDALLAGVLLAGWHRYRQASFMAFFAGRRSVLVPALALLLVAVKYVQIDASIFFIVGLIAAYVSAMLAVGLCVARGEVDKQWAWVVKPLAWIGGISYTTYLWHLLVLLVVEMATERLGLKGSFLEFFVYVLLSIFVGEVTSRLIERPALALRERWFPARGR